MNLLGTSKKQAETANQQRKYDIKTPKLKWDDLITAQALLLRL